MALKMAMPPIRAVGFLCQRSWDGIAIHPWRRATFLTSGVAIKPMPNALKNTIQSIQ